MAPAKLKPTRSFFFFSFCTFFVSFPYFSPCSMKTSMNLLAQVCVSVLAYINVPTLSKYLKTILVYC